VALRCRAIPHRQLLLTLTNLWAMELLELSGELELLSELITVACSGSDC